MIGRITVSPRSHALGVSVFPTSTNPGYTGTLQQCCDWLSTNIEYRTHLDSALHRPTWFWRGLRITRAWDSGNNEILINACDLAQVSTITVEY